MAFPVRTELFNCLLVKRYECVLWDELNNERAELAECRERATPMLFYERCGEHQSHWLRSTRISFYYIM